MRIGKQDRPFSNICTSDADSITVRGMDLCNDIIGELDFTSYFWLLVTGLMPTKTQQFFANAVLTAIAEHGLVPSVIASRMTIAAAPEALQGAVAAGLLGCGSVVLGSAEACGKFLAKCVPVQEELGQSAAAAAEAAVRDLRVARSPIPGLGHSQHSEADPRAQRLLALAENHGVIGRYTRMLYAVRDVTPAILGRPLTINVNGAIPAIMLDVGFPLNALKGVCLLARAAGLIGHLQEESEMPIGFILSGKAAEAIHYTGKVRQDPTPL